MLFLSSYKHTRGMTLVELLLAVAILMVVFGGLMAAFQVMLTLIGSSKAQAGALSLANEKIEYIRSLPYGDVGTIGGIPDGVIPQNSSSTLNGVLYDERVLVEYVDAPEDGEGALDSNGILADYKLVKVEYNWNDKGKAKTISLISNIIPRGIETTAGGGTLRVNVFNAAVLPLAGAAVRVYNNTGTTTIDTTRYTNADGVALFSGAPALSNYQITVTDTGYSTDQTYTASSTNPNPVTPTVSVLESQVSTMNFQIDELSSLTVETLGLPTIGTFEDVFDDASTVAATTTTEISSGSVILSGAPGSFSTTGTVFSTVINPGTLDSWGALSAQAIIPSNTDLLIRVYDTTGTTTPLLISDTDLPGNSLGFVPGTVVLEGLDVSTYQSLTLGATLSSADVATSSQLLQWKVTYTESQSAIPNILFSLTGDKVIGTMGSTSVYKYSKSLSTDGTGDVMIPNLEWDIYTLVVTSPGYVVAEACNAIPYILDPAVSKTVTLSLAAATPRSLQVYIVDANGIGIPDATIDLSRPSFSGSKVTSACGQVFFNSGLAAADDFVLTAQAFGYTSQTISDISIQGNIVMTVILSGS